MIGDESTVSHWPSSPTRTGQVPTFLQVAASSLSCTGGASREINLPCWTPRIVWVETMELSKAASRLESFAHSNGVVLRISTVTLNIPSSTHSLDTSMAPQTASLSRTI